MLIREKTEREIAAFMQERVREMDLGFAWIEKACPAVFTIEPRIPVPGRGIVTIEEMVVVTGDGAEYLGSPQKELLLIG